MPGSRAKIGFVGTGIMGGPMARNLGRAGFAVIAWNRSREKSDALGSSIRNVATAAEVAADADAVVCMLSSGPVCDEILLRTDGVLAAMRPGSLLIVMSSIPVETAHRQARAAEGAGILYVDAPVSGGEKGAIDGTLAIDLKPYVTAFDRPPTTPRCGWFDHIDLPPGATPASLDPDHRPDHPGG